MIYTKITIILNSNDKPPYFMGSQLRGAFGYALRDIDESLFNEFFSNKSLYRFDFLLAMQTYQFNLYLFSLACSQIHTIIRALKYMLSQIGLGEYKKYYKSFEIYVNDKKYQENESINSLNYKAKSYKKNIILHFLTPLRIKKNNIFIRDNSLEINDILSSIYQRKQKIQNQNLTKLPFKPHCITKSKNIFFMDIERKSNTQKTKMLFGGLLGQMWLEVDKQSHELLKLGEIIGVGKQTVFGLGKIKLGEINE